jgi:hypothetical protein
MGLPQTFYRSDLQPADLATVDELAHKPDRRAETVGVANYQCGTTSFESGDHLIAIVKRQCHRLFDDRVLAASRRQHGVLAKPLRAALRRRRPQYRAFARIRGARIHQSGRFSDQTDCIQRALRGN